MYHQHQIKIFSCRGSRYLAEKIAKNLGLELGKSSVTVFSDGEFQPALDESVRGSTVFIVQSTFPPVENIFELLLMIDAARRASAYKVIAVMPYFGWARQDRKDRPRVPIGAKMVANLLSAAGCDRVISADLHADQIQGFFDFPVDHIYASSIFLPYLRELKLENFSIAAPDMGGAKRADAYSRILECPLIMCHKSREKANVVGSITAIGDVKDRNIVIIDDMIDTAGTITKAADMLMDKGALSVRALATHAILSGPAYERIANSSLVEVILSDTVPLIDDPNVDKSKIKILSVANILADVIDKVYNNRSISTSFTF